MSIRFLLLASAAFVGAQTVAAQTNEIEVNDGTNATCYGASGAVPCGFFTQPTVDILVNDGAGNSSEVTTTTAQTTIQTTDGTNTSGLNVQSDATALETVNPSFGSAGLGTQTVTNAITGVASGQVVGIAEDTGGNRSELVLEGQVATLRTEGPSGSLSLVETNQDRTLIGYAADGQTVNNGLLSDAIGNQLVGNTAAAGNFSVSGTTSLNGLDNNGAGITNAGLVSGVMPGVVSGTSTDAVNGAQLFTTNSNVSTAQTTADSAVNDAAAAQSTADSALTNAATAQMTADTALANAATAQTTADSAFANAATAQTTADTAVADAATAQTSANSALANAATAQSTADTALTQSAAAQAVAGTANTNASEALALAETSVQYDDASRTSVTMNPGGASATRIRNVAAGTAPSDAVNMQQLTAVSSSVTNLGNRVASLETLVANVNVDIRKLDRMAGRGVAIATAIASVPPIRDDQKIGIGVGMGTYDGRTAFSAAIIGRISDNAQFRVNAGTTGNGKVAAGGGFTLGW
jgi:hypothetical protein